MLIFHGYLLRGTGSNVYNASLARALARLGHEVHLLCQDRGAAELPWVGAVGEWRRGRLRVSIASGEACPAGEGSITAYLPEIGGLLPVYVRDEYEGFRVKTFSELSGDELERYIDANVAAVGDVLERLGGVDAALANHLVMGPVILARAGLRYALKVHGSDLSYTVLPELERFRPYAEEAVAGAAGILVGSTHIAERLRLAVGTAAEAKLRSGPPGVDTELFAPVAPDDAPARLRDFAARLRPQPPASWGRDPAAGAEAIEAYAAAPGARVVFVGKLIVSKGVDLLCAAWPLVVASNPGARLLVVGFGEYAGALRDLVDALGRGEVAAAAAIAARGWGLEGGEERPLPLLTAFLAEPPAGYAGAARGAAGSIAFAGRLEHDEVAEVVPPSDALVFPSTFPEAFGMVAAEAAAASVLPVSAGHSGALEVSRALAAELPPEVAPLVSFPLTGRVVEGIAERLNAWLALAPERRLEARRALRLTAAQRWSWEGVARSVIAASAGDLDGLPRIDARA